MDFEAVADFHGHACPGLALGYRVALLARQELGPRAEDEEIVAVVENNSCAVDAIQAVLGCTFGKGNLVFRDYGKQVYTFFKRPGPGALRIAVSWQPPPETPETAAAWRQYMAGNRSEALLELVRDRKSRKMAAILAAATDDLFTVTRIAAAAPEPARIFPSIACSRCGEKVMEPKTVPGPGGPLCIPCAGS